VALSAASIHTNPSSNSSPSVSAKGFLGRGPVSVIGILKSSVGFDYAKKIRRLSLQGRSPKQSLPPKRDCFVTTLLATTCFNIVHAREGLSIRQCVLDSVSGKNFVQKKVHDGKYLHADRIRHQQPADPTQRRAGKRLPSNPHMPATMLQG